MDTTVIGSLSPELDEAEADAFAQRIQAARRVSAEDLALFRRLGEALSRAGLSYTRAEQVGALRAVADWQVTERHVADMRALARRCAGNLADAGWNLSGEFPDGPGFHTNPADRVVEQLSRPQSPGRDLVDPEPESADGSGRHAAPARSSVEAEPVPDLDPTRLFPPHPAGWVHPARRVRRDWRDLWAVLPAYLMYALQTGQVSEKFVLGYLRLRLRGGEEQEARGALRDLARAAGWTTQEAREWICERATTAIAAVMEVEREVLNRREELGSSPEEDTPSTWWTVRFPAPAAALLDEADAASGRHVSRRDAWVPAWWLSTFTDTDGWQPVRRPGGATWGAIAVVLDREDRDGRTRHAASWHARRWGWSDATTHRRLAAAARERLVYVTGNVTGGRDRQATRVAVLHPDEWRASDPAPANRRSPGRPPRQPCLF